MEIEWGPAILLATGMAVLAACTVFGIASAREKEKRATRIAFILGATVSPLFFVAALLPPPARAAVAVMPVAALGVIALFFFLPIGRISPGDDIPAARCDERDIMFARARLRPGTREYDSYYAMRPEHRRLDDYLRSRPGLLSPKARFSDPLLFASAAAGFHLTCALREAVDGPVSDGRVNLPPERMTSFLKSLARYYGALDAGVAKLEPWHIYSHIGRGSGVYGSEVRLEHRYAIAFTVEMDFHMIGANPAAPGVAESARQYVESARVAVQLAAAIRKLGYPARAHIDGDYRVVAPLVARDAGLGQIGRMGLVVTPALGPRVRLGVVTTDVPIVPDARTKDMSVIDFCTVCRKCAENCPSRAIPFAGRSEIDGALRWKIDSEACYRYWCTAGTDCGVCLSVCPYSHPDSLIHNWVRWAIARSGAARRLALRMDDCFYGRKPAPRDAPEWTRSAAAAHLRKEKSAAGPAPADKFDFTIADSASCEGKSAADTLRPGKAKSQEWER